MLLNSIDWRLRYSTVLDADPLRECNQSEKLAIMLRDAAVDVWHFSVLTSEVGDSSEGPTSASTVFSFAVAAAVGPACIGGVKCRRVHLW